MATGSTAATGSKAPQKKQQRKRSPAALQTAIEKSEAATAALLKKFKEQKLLACPLANQVKRLKADFDTWAENEELRDGMGEQGSELLRAVSDTHEAARQVLSLLMSFSNMRQALTPALKIFANLEKQAVQDFLAEAKCSRSLTVMEGHLPAEYLETELKILACQAWKHGEPAELLDTLSKSVLAKRFHADATLQVQRSVQCSASGLGSRGVFVCGCWAMRQSRFAFPAHDYTFALHGDALHAEPSCS